MSYLSRRNDRALVAVPGSLADTAAKGGQSLAEAFVTAEAVVLVDVSGSMGMRDSREGRQRYEVALEELAALQAAIPGRVAVIAFADKPQFCPGGQPPFLAGSTDLTAALKFARVADVAGMRFVIVSDGVPDNPVTALAEARAFTSRIDSVFVGPESDGVGGGAFLAQLSGACGGQAVTADRVQELAAKVERLLLGA
jgi:hypothetical protein